MRSGFTIFALSCALTVASASAESLTIPGHIPTDTAQIMPKRGINMELVLAEFGEPDQRYGPIGEPPISEWVYGNFRVYFEHQTVLHTINLSTLIMPSGQVETSN